MKIKDRFGREFKNGDIFLYINDEGEVKLGVVTIFPGNSTIYFNHVHSEVTNFWDEERLELENKGQEKLFTLRSEKPLVLEDCFDHPEYYLTIITEEIDTKNGKLYGKFW